MLMQCEAMLESHAPAMGVHWKMVEKMPAKNHPVQTRPTIIEAKRKAGVVKMRLKRQRIDILTAVMVK